MLRRTLVLAGVVLAVAARAGATEWGTIVVGSSTMDSVRAHYGGPTRTETQKLDSYDTARWVYEGAQAPGGIQRMLVDFGLLQAGGYRRDVVRSLTLEPKPGIFTRGIVILGWGKPDRVGTQGDDEVYFYSQGLVAIFGKDGAPARTLVFTLPQPLEPERPAR